MSDGLAAGGQQSGSIWSERALAAVAFICILLPLAAAGAQTTPAEGLLPPPSATPESRLTVTPAEFEQWLTGIAPADDTAIARKPADAPPSLVTPPPPPPTLVAPPLPPSLVMPPRPPAITPGPAAITPVTPPDRPAAPQQPGLTPQPAPVLETPSAPQIATLPSNPPATTPPPPPGTPPRPGLVKIVYAEGVTALSAAAKADLAGLAAWLRQNPDVRVQIVGYASDAGKAGNQARRTSLDRTLAVRNYLIDNGVVSTRMGVRALGARTDELPRDRVEISAPPS